jgi:DNA-binding MarR family transcriptional regulator
MRKESSTEKIISLTFNIGRSINKQYFDENSKESNLSILHIETLRFIRENRGVLMKELAGHLFITPPSATSLVNELVSRKLGGRSFNKKDRRITKVSLTKKGAIALEKALMKKMEKIGDRIDKLSYGEKKFLLKVLEKLAREDN